MRRTIQELFSSLFLFPPSGAKNFSQHPVLEHLQAHLLPFGDKRRFMPEKYFEFKHLFSMIRQNNKTNGRLLTKHQN
jgi:hypothetical protein